MNAVRADIDLLEVPNPEFIIRVGGERYVYEPFAILKKMEEMGLSQVDVDSGSVSTQLDAIVNIFAFNAKDKPEVFPGKPAITDHQAMVLLARFMAFVKELEVLKNLQALTQN